MEEEDDIQYSEEELEAVQKQAAMGFGYPTPPDKENIFKFFKELMDKEDSSKVGNLSKTELGMPKASVRGFQSIALYAEAEGYGDVVGKYLRSEAEIALSTSTSLKGFLATLFVTQIKREHKVKPNIEKKGWFDKRDKPEQQAGEI